MNRLYEILFVVKPDVNNETLKAIIQKVSSLVEGQQGSIVNVDEWGKRKLAYPIQRYNDGQYVLVNFSGNASVPAEIERMLRLNENILRFQTVKKEKAQKNLVSKETDKGAEVQNV